MSIKLTVPEAATTPDTIQFKLVLEGEIQSETKNIFPISFRTFQQISWIHNRLKKAFPIIVLPPLPEQLNTLLIEDQDYVERKRLQIERFFEKIIKRPELTDHPDFIHFLSSDMSLTEVGPTNTGVLSFLRFNRVIKPSTDKVFKSYKPSEILKGDKVDQDIFHKHQIYILLQESYYGFIAESLNQLIQARESLGDILATMGDLIIETTQSKYRLGLGLKPEFRESQRMLDRKMQMFGLLMDELCFIFTRQGKEELMRFGDVMLEYKNSLDPLKVVFNARTVKLMDYVDHLKFHNKKKERAEKLTLRLGVHHPEVKEVIQEEKEASNSLDKSKEEFDECQDKVKNEIQLFEEQKSKDLKKAIKDYVNLSIRYEKLQLQNLEKTLNDMQQPILKTPFLYQLPSTEQKDNTSESSSSGSSSKYTQKKKRHSKSPIQEFKKPLQSSASLPTRHTNKDKKKISFDQDTKTSNSSPNISSDNSEENRTISIGEDKSNRLMSASYDDRLSSNWLSE